jgi:hypothetical protein
MSPTEIPSGLDRIRWWGWLAVVVAVVAFFGISYLLDQLFSF